MANSMQDGITMLNEIETPMFAWADQSDSLSLRDAMGSYGDFMIENGIQNPITYMSMNSASIQIRLQRCAMNAVVTRESTTSGNSGTRFSWDSESWFSKAKMNVIFRYALCVGSMTRRHFVLPLAWPHLYSGGPGDPPTWGKIESPYAPGHREVIFISRVSPTCELVATMALVDMRSHSRLDTFGQKALVPINIGVWSLKSPPTVEALGEMFVSAMDSVLDRVFSVDDGRFDVSCQACESGARNTESFTIDRLFIPSTGFCKDCYDAAVLKKDMIDMFSSASPPPF
ncbi:hypothetical protein SEA_AUSTIN_70 [Gordonia phage Austin]|nr:hypothetical protein SEA_AUSTIN_70 [Gordonia phage Austin]